MRPKNRAQNFARGRGRAVQQAPSSNASSSDDSREPNPQIPVVNPNALANALALAAGAVPIAPPAGPIPGWVGPAIPLAACQFSAAFFANLPAHNWPMFVAIGPPMRCLACQREPGAHPQIPAGVVPMIQPAVAQVVPADAAAFAGNIGAAIAGAAGAALPADLLLRAGPHLLPVLSPEERLRDICRNWGAFGFLSSDREIVDRAFADVLSASNVLWCSRRNHGWHDRRWNLSSSYMEVPCSTFVTACRTGLVP